MGTAIGTLGTSNPPSSVTRCTPRRFQLWVPGNTSQWYPASPASTCAFIAMGFSSGRRLARANSRAATMICGWVVPPGNYFDGELDEFRIWNVARAGSEIAGSLNARLAGNESGLVAYYRMDDGSGSLTLIDASINANNGTLSNGVLRVAAAVPACGLATQTNLLGVGALPGSTRAIRRPVSAAQTQPDSSLWVWSSAIFATTSRPPAESPAWN